MGNPRSYAAVLIFVLLPSAFFILSTGCQDSGSKSDLAERKVKVQYKGLAGQKVGVMVWADRGVKIDWNSIQLDLANQIQDLLVKQGKASELKETTWPVMPASIVRYQRDHPNVDTQPITEVAPRLGVTRLIYVEIESFSTRSEVSLQMFRGNATVALKVIEINGNQANVAYEETGIRATYPPGSPVEGKLDSSDVAMYRGELTALAGHVARRLVTLED